MATVPIFRRGRGRAADHPVELRFVDMLLIVIATLMFVAVVLSVTSAFSTRQPGGGRPVAAPQITTDSVAPAGVGSRVGASPSISAVVLAWTEPSMNCGRICPVLVFAASCTIQALGSALGFSRIRFASSR